MKVEIEDISMEISGRESSIERKTLIISNTRYPGSINIDLIEAPSTKEFSIFVTKAQAVQIRDGLSLIIDHLKEEYDDINVF